MKGPVVSLGELVMTTSNSGVDFLSRVVGYEAQSSTADDDINTQQPS
jgi:hypothetical protein